MPKLVSRRETVLMRTHIDRATIIQLVATALLACSTGQTQAAFMFVSESVLFNSATGQAQFTIAFNQPPDFFTLDTVGRQANSFQYFIVGDPGLTYPDLYDSIIRAEEIHI